jgi:hypothetical protein
VGPLLAELADGDQWAEITDETLSARLNAFIEAREGSAGGAAVVAARLHRLFGPDAAHNLRDVYLDWLAHHPEERAFLAMIRPEGPPAVSFIRGTPPKVPCRYDAIYASPEFAVLDVRYVYDDAIRAGSDHGLVWARLHLDEQ